MDINNEFQKIAKDNKNKDNFMAAIGRYIIILFFLSFVL